MSGCMGSHKTECVVTSCQENVKSSQSHKFCCCSTDKCNVVQNRGVIVKYKTYNTAKLPTSISRKSDDYVQQVPVSYLELKNKSIVRWHDTPKYFWCINRVSFFWNMISQIRGQYQPLIILFLFAARIVFPVFMKKYYKKKLIWYY